MATIVIERLTSTGPTHTNVTSTNSRIDASDAHSTNSTANPVSIPTSGLNYSYWATFRLKCTVAPTTLINNIKFYMDGSNTFGTDVDLYGYSAYQLCASYWKHRNRR